MVEPEYAPKRLKISTLKTISTAFDWPQGVFGRTFGIVRKHHSSPEVALEERGFTTLTLDDHINKMHVICFKAWTYPLPINSNKHS
jgi:hypothetical protein